jgi:hypothetical protein
LRGAVVLVAAAVCYLVDLLVALLVPDLGKQFHASLIIVPLIAEVWMVVYLLVKGVRSPHPASHPFAADLAPKSA